MPKITQVEIKDNAIRVCFPVGAYTIPTGEIFNPVLSAQVNKLIDTWAKTLGVTAVGAAKKREVLLRLRQGVELPLYQPDARR